MIITKLSESYFRFISLLVLLVSILLIYSSSLSGGFVYDDILFIRDNPVLSEGIESIFRYMPLRFISFLTFAANYHAGGTAPLGYHVVNLIIHMTNALLVYWLVRLLLVKTPAIVLSTQHWIAWFCAAFFSLHPLQTEAVAYMTQRFTSLAACFYLLSLCLFLSRYRTLSLVSALLAMFTKEHTLTLPAVVLMTEYVLRFPRHRWWTPALHALPYGLIAACAYGVFVTFPAENVRITEQGLPQVESVGMSRTQYALTEIPVLIRYLGLFIFPVGQTIIHDVSPVTTIMAPKVLGGLLIALLLIGTSLWAKKRYPLVAYGIWFFFLTLSIESSIIPLGDVLLEHRMYLPMVGLIIALCTPVYLGIRNHHRLGRGVVVLLCGMLLGYAGATYRRTMVWQDGFSLWSDAVAKSPRRSLGYWGLSMALIERGDGPAAEESLRTAIRLNPGTIFPYINLGIIYTGQGKYQEAEEVLREANTIDPKNVAVLNALGTVLARQKREKEAVPLFETAILTDPDNAAAYNNLGSIAAQTGEKERAKELFMKALSFDPAYAAARENLSRLR